MPTGTIAETPHDTFPSQTVLVVDDEEGMRSFLCRVLRAEGYAVEVAADGPSALASIAARPPDVVLLDVNLPGLSGFEICRRLRQDVATRLTPIISVTALDASDQRVEGLEAGADDYLSKPIDRRELIARVRSLARLKRYTDDLDSASSIIMTLATMIEVRDGYGRGHCSRMANHATRLGRALNLSDGELQVLYRGGFLHDIGMLAIPEPVLRKNGPLEAHEYELVRSHTIVGDVLCANLRSFQPIRPIIRSHHERLDGSGYPDGLRGDRIPVVAQIVGVVDVYEALTAERPYQRTHSADEAIAVLRRQVDQGWLRRDFVEVFVDSLSRA